MEASFSDTEASALEVVELMYATIPTEISKDELREREFYLARELFVSGVERLRVLHRHAQNGVRIPRRQMPPIPP